MGRPDRRGQESVERIRIAIRERKLYQPSIIDASVQGMEKEIVWTQVAQNDFWQPDVGFKRNIHSHKFKIGFCLGFRKLG